MKSPWQQRVDEALAGGEVWRAKEILRGNLARLGYDAEVHRRLGELQLSLGERHDAGRSLLLGGSESPEHQPAIEAFVARQRRRRAGVAAGLPGRVLSLPLEELPARLRRELEAEGHRPRPRASEDGGSGLGCLGGLLLLGFVGVLLLGLVSLGRIVLDVLRWKGGD